MMLGMLASDSGEKIVWLTLAFTAMRPDLSTMLYSGLGQGSDRADLHETKTEEAQHVNRLAVLVETGCKPDRVGKFDAKHFALKFFVIFLIQRPDERIENPDFLEHPQHPHREAVNLLRITKEEQRPYYMLVHSMKNFCKDNDFLLVKNFSNRFFC